MALALSSVPLANGSTAYVALISIFYFVQLTFVGPRLARGQVEGIEVFLFVPFDSFLYAVDILGYSFMSLATLFAAMGGGRSGMVATRQAVDLLARRSDGDPLQTVQALSC
jgi:hypothetical protein